MEELFDDELIYHDQGQVIEEDELFDIENFMNDLKKSGLDALSFLKQREGSYNLEPDCSKKTEHKTISFTAEAINIKIRYQQLSLF